MLTFAPAIGLAQTAAFTYQGRLLDSGGPADGSYDLLLALADAQAGGHYVAGPITNAPVPVSKGLFTVTLEFGGRAFDGSARWLEIGVRTNGSSRPYTSVYPRQPISVTPYATFANTAATAVTATSLTPGAAIWSTNLVASSFQLARTGTVAASGTVSSPDFSGGGLHCTNLSFGPLQLAGLQSRPAMVWNSNTDQGLAELHEFQRWERLQNTALPLSRRRVQQVA
jgi:hypothetical protein